jgi:ribonuclease J
MKMPNVTFYGGVNEIGGSKILLEDGDAKVLLDFGMSFALRNQYYSVPFLSPRNERELLEFGILPELEGVYKFDDTEPKIDAVFLSHSHMDHAAYVSFLKRKIPVYCGETTATILDAYSEARVQGLEFNFKGLKFRTFRTGDKIKLASFEIEPVHVDHSIPGSYGFIIHTSSSTVVYTGDFRRHGSKPSLTEDFLERSADAGSEALITEHTNMTGVEISSEEEVMRKLNDIVQQTTGLVLADFASADVDRLRSFYEVAVTNGRRLVVTLRQAHLLHRLSEDPHLNIPKIEDETLRIYRKPKKRYYNWERATMELGQTVDSGAIREEQNDMIMVLPFHDLAGLVDIKPSAGSSYILSTSEPFNEEMVIDFEKLMNWLEYYGLPQYHVHVSGHITPLHLRESLKMIEPKMIFPIHGTHPELFSEYMRDLNSKTCLPETGKCYKIP